MNRWLGFFCCWFVLFAQAQHVAHWSEKNGLSSRLVNHCIRASDGYLWIATKNGLNRFNGYEFLTFTTSNCPQLKSNHITHLLEFPAGMLWVATDNGIHLLNIKTNQIVDYFKKGSGGDELTDDYILQIYQTQNHDVWVTTANGILHKYLGNKKFKRIYNPKATDKSFGKRLRVIEYKNSLWLKTQHAGVYQLNKNSLKVIKHYLKNESSYDEAGASIMLNAGLLFMMKNGIKQYNNVTDSFSTFNLPQLYDVFAIVASSNNQFWITADGRKSLYQYQNGHVKNIGKYLFNYSQNVHINCIVPANNNDIWICTNNGLYKFINEELLFNNILTKTQVPQKLYVPSYRGIYQDKGGDMFFAGYGGLFKTTSQGNVVCLFDNKTPISPSMLLPYDDDFLWVISEGYGLLKVNKKTGVIHSLPKDEHKYNYLTVGITYNKNTLLLGGYDELVWYNIFTNKYTNCKLIYKGKTYERPNVKYILKDRNNHVWVCTTNGVFVLNNQHKVIKRYAEDETIAKRIPVNAVNHVFEDNESNIWLSTNGGGLCCVAKNGNVTQLISTQTGLADNNVAFCVKDNANMLWVGTFNGLSIIDSAKQIHNFYVEDGLSDNEFNSASVLISQSGKIYMGGINGINITQTNRLSPAKNNTTRDKVIISAIELMQENNAIAKIDDASQIAKGVELSSKQSYLAVTFFNTDFTHPSKNIFFYKLEGLNNDWIALGEKNNLQFASLAPGKYRLLIQGKSAKTNTDTHIASLSILVNEVFYKTWWFITLMCGLVVLTVIIITNMRVQKLKELSALRAKIASDLHDDVGSVLTRVAMQAEMLEDEADVVNKTALANIVRTCRMAMSNMRDVIWSTNINHNNVGNLYDKITEMVQQMLQYSSFNYKINFSRDLAQLEISQPHKQEIYFILKEAFHNVLKHANGNVVELNAYKQNNSIWFTVANNCTYTPTALTTGSGIQHMQMRAKRINANLTITINNLFEIKLEIPLKRNQLK